MFKINPIIEGRYDEPSKNISNRLSGRVIFFEGENFILEKSDGDKTIDFFCGPETSDGSLEDTYDCGLYEQLKKVFGDNKLDVDVGSAENYHILTIPKKDSPEEYWQFLKRVLINNGAVEVDY